MRPKLLSTASTRVICSLRSGHARSQLINVMVSGKRFLPPSVESIDGKVVGNPVSESIVVGVVSLGLVPAMRGIKAANTMTNIHERRPHQLASGVRAWLWGQEMVENFNLAIHCCFSP